MTPLGLLAVAGPSPLWYLTRATGLVTLVLLSASVVLGVVNTSQLAGPRWPRFATAGLHRNISLMVVVLVGIHILTAELDTFAPVGWPAVVVPFASRYRPIWLGLGTFAFDLLLAVTATSLLRARLGYRRWRLVHWLAYASWPVAVVHGLGTGTDARLSWVLGLTVVCVAAVAAAASWRLATGWASQPGRQVLVGASAVVVTIVVMAWAATGPLRPGWAHRAGTPSPLLATASVSPGSGAPLAATSPTPAPAAGLAVPSSATLSGQLTQAGPTGAGVVTITILAHLSGGLTGSLRVVLQGRAAGGGVALAASSVSLSSPASPARYQGRVVALQNDQLVASVSAPPYPSLQLAVNLVINPTTGTVGGTVQASTPTSGDGR